MVLGDREAFHNCMCSSASSEPADEETLYGDLLEEAARGLLMR